MTTGTNRIYQNRMNKLSCFFFSFLPKSYSRSNFDGSHKRKPEKEKKSCFGGSLHCDNTEVTKIVHKLFIEKSLR